MVTVISKWDVLTFPDQIMTKLQVDLNSIAIIHASCVCLFRTIIAISSLMWAIIKVGIFIQGFIVDNINSKQNSSLLNISHISILEMNTTLLYLFVVICYSLMFNRPGF